MPETLNSNTLLVIGDALEDIYLQGSWALQNNIQRFKPKSVLSYPGGAANTAANAQAILEDKAKVITWMNKNPLRLYRLIAEDTKEIYTDFANEWSCVPEKITIPESVDGIVISDYNKGIVNGPCDITTRAPWIIVDSRYRSVHPSWLELGAIKIWRCTGKEWDSEWAKQFHYVVHTDGPNVVTLLSTHLKKPISGFVTINNCTSCFNQTQWNWYVPSITPVDTCGAGDTFTAMLSAQLLEMYVNINQAIPLCIKAAQEVCMQKHTAITTIKL